MLNSLGLGFVLSAKDKDLTKNVEGAQKQFGLLGKSMDTVKSAGVGMIGAVMNGLSPRRLMPMAGQVQNIANDFKVTTTGIEAFGVAADKVTSQSLAGLNMTQKDLSKAKSQIASIAYGMNTDVGAVTKSFKTLHQAGIDINKIGFKGLEEYQKFIEVTGVDQDKFAESLGMMKHQLKLSDKQISDSLKTVLALGKRFDIGGEAAQLMADSVGMISREGATMFETMSPDEVKKFIEGTQEIAIAFKKVGFSAQDSSSLAINMGRTMMKGRENVNAVFSGMDDDMSEMMKNLTENFGGFGDAFSLIQKDPAKMALAIMKAEKQIQASGPGAEAKLMRFNEQLQKAFGPEMVAMIARSDDKTIRSLEDVQKEMAKPGGLADKNGVITKIASNYRDGLTDSDKFTRAQDIFRTKLKQLGDMKNADFLKTYIHSTNVMTDRLKEISSGNGVAAKATRLLIDFSNFGLGGVASQINKTYGPAMMSLIQQFGPILSQVPAITSAFSALFSPITLVGGAIAGLYFYFKDADKGGNEFSHTVDDLAAKLPGIIEGMIPKIKVMLHGVWKVIETVAPVVWDALKKLIGMIWEWLKSVDWGMVAKVVLSAVITAAKFLVSTAIDVLVAFVKAIPAIFSGLWSVLKDQFGDWAYAIMPILTLVAAAMVAAAAQSMVAWVADLFVIESASEATFLKLTLSWVRVMVTMAAQGALAAGKIAFSFMKVGAAMVADMLKATGAILMQIGKMVVQFGIAAIEMAADWVIAMGPVGMVIAGIAAVGAAIVGIIHYWDDIKNAAKSAWDSITGFFSSGSSAAKTYVDEQKAAQSQTATTGNMIVAMTKQVTMAIQEAQSAAERAANYAKLVANEFEALGPNKMVAQYQKLNDQLDEMRKSGASDEIIKQQQDEIGKLGQQIESTWGISADVVERRKKSLDKIFALDKDSMDQLTAMHNAGNALARDNYINNVAKMSETELYIKQRYKNEGEKLAAEYAKREIEIQKNAENLTEAQLNQRIEAIEEEAKRVGKINEMAMQFEIETTNKANATKAFSDDIYEKGYYASTLRMRDADERLTRGLTGNLKQEVTQRLSTLDEGENKELQALKAHHFATIGEYKAAADKVVATYDKQRQELSRVLDSQRALIASNTEDSQRIVVSSLDKVTNSWKGMLDNAGKIYDQFLNTTAGASQKATDAAMKAKKDTEEVTAKAMANLGVTQADSVDILKSLIGRNKAQIVKDLDDIGATYSKFLTTVLKNSQKLYTDSRTMTNKFMDESKQAWEDGMVNVLKNYTTKAQDVFKGFWDAIISMSKMKSRVLSDVIKGSMSTPTTESSSRVATTSLAKTPASAAATTPFDNLINHIDSPAWVGGMREQMTKENDELTKRLDLLVSATLAGKKVSDIKQGSKIEENILGTHNTFIDETH